MFVSAPEPLVAALPLSETPGGSCGLGRPRTGLENDFAHPVVAAIARRAIMMLLTVDGTVRGRLSSGGRPRFEQALTHESWLTYLAPSALQPPDALYRHIPEPRPKPYRDPVAKDDPVPMTLEAFSDLQSVAKTYLEGRVIDLGLDGVDTQVARRAIDWISGLVFGTNGEMKRIDHLRLRLNPPGTFSSS